MVESRTTILRDIFKPWYIKALAAAGLLFTVVNGYAGFQDQFPKLPKLQDVLAVPYLGFLPWWGWLLVWLIMLLGVFEFALFEYVRRNLPILPKNGEGESKQSSAGEPAASITYKYDQRHMPDRFGLTVVVRALKSAKDVAIFGRKAILQHYITGHSEWIWTGSVRLFEQTSFAKGEVLTRQILFREDSGDLDIVGGFGTTTTIFDNKRKTGAGELILVEITVASDAGTVTDRICHNFRNINGAKLSEPVPYHSEMGVDNGAVGY